MRIALLAAAIIVSVVASYAAGNARVFVAAEPSMPVYRIGQINIDLSNRNDPQVVVPWQMVRPGIGSPTVRAITGNRTLILILAGVSGNRAGTLRFDYEGSTRQPAEVAVWFEINRARKPTNLVSNVSTLGKIDPSRLPKIGGAKELAEFAEKDKRLPPKTLPLGYVPVLRSHPIVPGLIGKAADNGRWIDAELLAVDSRGWITVKYAEHVEPPVRLLPTLPSGTTSFFVVRPNLLASAKNNPRRFRPSQNILPGTTSEIPEGYVALSTAKVPPGLPVKFSFSIGWRDGINLSSDKSLASVRTNYGGRVETNEVPLASMVVLASDAKKLGSRNAMRIFAKNLEIDPDTD